MSRSRASLLRRRRSDHRPAEVRSGSGNASTAQVRFGTPDRSSPYSAHVEKTRSQEVGRASALHRLWLAALVIGALVVLAGGPLDRIDLDVRPSDSFGAGFGEVGIVAPVSVGDTLIASVASADRTVAIDSAELVIADDSAAAAVELVACQRREGSPIVGSAIGETLSSFCEAVLKPAGVSVGGPVDGRETYLLAVVQPLQPGRVIVEGVRVTHSRGPFHRTERTGGAIEVIAQ